MPARSRSLSITLPRKAPSAAIVVGGADQGSVKHDILIFAPTCWQLRGAVKIVNPMLRALGLEKHLDKTFIGSIGAVSTFLATTSVRQGSQEDNCKLHREGISA
jgi:hypothetical protein